MVREQEDPGDTGRTARLAERYVSRHDDLDRTDVATIGGKGAQLARIARLKGVSVPGWFCVTTGAYRRAMADVPAFDYLLDELATVAPEDVEAAAKVATRIRNAVEHAGVPQEVAALITEALRELGEGTGYAVRSSATAEDLPSASFAGQHDTYLNVVGLAAVIGAVSRCWASLFTERAVVYRMRKGINHRAVEMAVVIQQMVQAQASGVLFTADPVTANRKVASIEATLGLGEGLVSGTVDSDSYRVRDGIIISRAISHKRVAVHAAPGGSTTQQSVEVGKQGEPALSDEQVHELVGLGRRIESDAGYPQDIEWCLDRGGMHVVQSRPITTIFPVPDAEDARNRVYISVGHGQMMTDPMTPLGLSMWQLTSPAPMRTAGGRLFVDATARLSSPAARAATLEVIGRSDLLTRNALETVLERDDFIPTVADEHPNGPSGGPGGPSGRPNVPQGEPDPIPTDPAIVADLIETNRASVSRLEREIRARSGQALFDFILDDLVELRALLFGPRSHQAVMAGFQATWWLNDNLAEWLGEQNPAAVLSLAAPNNVSAEMGLALLDVADAIRPHPGVVAFLRGVQHDDFLDDLVDIDGGEQARGAIVSYLDTYGMRCIGEIDIARPRWREQPSSLVPVLLADIDRFGPGERERRLRHGRQQATQKAQELLTRLRALRDGEAKAAQTERMIDRLRTFIGYREYPKYGMVSRYDMYRQALLAEGERLVDTGVLRAVDDIYFLSFSELRDVARTGIADHQLIAARRQDFRRFADLNPPRVLTSKGETFNGAYRRDGVPAGALVGLAVSGGIVEGRARVVFDMSGARLEPGDILVTPHTDPSWSPLFVTIAGLVTEVGGVMTHGAVIAREYGLAAVVGVEGATGRIRDGQRIRVDGTAGLVEILADPVPRCG